MMKKRRKSTLLTATIMTLGLVSAFTVGLASWLIVNDDSIGTSVEINGAEVNGDTNNDTAPNGFAVSVSAPKIGRYFFEQNNANTSNGTLKYSFTIDPSKFSGSLSGVKTFYMSGTLSLLYKNGSVIEEHRSFLSSSYTYVARNFSWDGANKNMTVAVGDYVAAIPKLDVNNLVSRRTFELEFNLLQTCVLDNSIRELLKDSSTKFQLRLRVGTEQ